MVDVQIEILPGEPFAYIASGYLTPVMFIRLLRSQHGIADPGRVGSIVYARGRLVSGVGWQLDGNDGVPVTVWRVVT